MTVQVIASGSKGNCTALDNGKATILLDAGIGFNRIQKTLNFVNPTAALITHEHSDHAKLTTINEFLKRGVDLFMTAGTAQALDLQNRYNLHYLENGKCYSIGDFFFETFDAKHDAASPVNFFVSDHYDTLAYVTDTGAISETFQKLFHEVTKLVIETNYSSEQLMRSNIETKQKLRISANHLSLEQVIQFLTAQDLSKLTEIHLIHISSRHGDKQNFSQLIKNISEHTKIFAY